MMLRVIARAKANKLTGDRQLKSRSRRLSRLQSSMVALQAKVRRDLRSSDPDRFLTALAVGIMTETGEDPVIGARKKNVTMGEDGGASFRQSGKRKAITNATIVRALQDAYAAKEDDEELFSHDMGRVTAEKVNEYLGSFKLSMQDVRGMLANGMLPSKLQALRASGGELPKHKRSRAKVLSKEFFQALDDVAESTGLEADMVRYNYTSPGLESSYLSDGTVGKVASADGLATRVATRFLNEP